MKSIPDPSTLWEKPDGSLVPATKVKEHHKLEDELVRNLTASAHSIHNLIKAFKDTVFEKTAEHRDLVAREYQVSKGGKGGNMTLRSYDGRLEVEIQVAKSITFGPELDAAKTLIDQCVARWAEGANDNIRALVEHAFQVNKTGKIDTARVLGLRQLKIQDADWKRAMDAIGDAVRETGSKTYVRFYERDTETGQRKPISLDIAAV